MIPAELDEEGNVIAGKVREYSMLMSKKVTEIDNSIQYFLNEASTSNIINVETVVAANQVSNYVILHCVIALSLCSFKFINFHQLAYEYFYGSNDKRNDIMKQIKDEFLRMKNEMQEELSSKVNYIDEKIDKMNKSNEQNFDNLDKRIDQLNQGMDKKDRVEKTRPLKLTTCLDAIEEVYDDPKYNYTQQFKLHPYAIRNQLSSWNQYLDTGGEKGKPPLPDFDFYRHTDKTTFKKWVRDIFFPDYRERSHKDALTNASHPDNIDNIYVPAQQDIIDEVDESLANDHHDNKNNKQQDSTSNRNK